MTWLFAAGLISAVIGAARGTWSPCGESMLSSITPVGERTRGYRWGVTVAMFLTAATLGGAFTGWVIGHLGAFLLDGRAGLVTVAVLAAAVIAAVVDGTSLRRYVNWPHRQVDERWFSTHRRWVYATLFGAQLGLGFLTVIPAALILLIALLAAGTGDPVAAAIIGATFGATRGLSLFAVVRANDPVVLRRIMAKVSSTARPAQVATTVTSIGVAGIALAALVS